MVKPFRHARVFGSEQKHLYKEARKARDAFGHFKQCAHELEGGDVDKEHVQETVAFLQELEHALSQMKVSVMKQEHQNFVTLGNVQMLLAEHDKDHALSAQARGIRVYVNKKIDEYLRLLRQQIRDEKRIRRGRHPRKSFLLRMLALLLGRREMRQAKETRDLHHEQGALLGEIRDAVGDEETFKKILAYLEIYEENLLVLHEIMHETDVQEDVIMHTINRWERNHLHKLYHELHPKMRAMIHEEVRMLRYFYRNERAVAKELRSAA